MPRRGIAALVSTAAVLWAAAPAAAATVNLTAGHGSMTLRLAARPGELNDVVLDRTPAGFLVQQRSARLAAGRGCRLLERFVAFCAVAPGERRELSAEVDAGDGDDRLDIGQVAAPVDEIALNGGPGDDLLLGASRTPRPASADGLGDVVLDGGPGDDRLIGGAARETLQGGTGADDLRGGRGDDVLAGDPVEAGRALPVFPDRLDGGKGEDVADYSLRRRPVTVDLAASRPAGEAGERDVLRGIDDVWGGDARNVLRGDDGPNELVGGPADDRISGRGGDDLLDGVSGADALDGGPGDDRLRGVSRPPACGPGVDGLELQALALPPFGPDCEWVILGGELGVTVPLQPVTGHIVRVRVTPYARTPFTGTLTIAGRDGTLLAEGQAWLVRRSPRTVALDLTEAGDRQLDHRPDVRAVLRFRDRRDDPGTRPPRGLGVTLRR